MRTRDEVAAQLRQRFHRDYPDWARRRGSWPLRINLQPPTTAERSQDPVTCHDWANQWAAYDGAGSVEYANTQFPTGVHPMPRRLTFATPGAVAAATPDTLATWQRCGARLIELERTFPRATFDRIIRRATDLEDQDYRRLVSTTKWILEHPTSGMLLRQLPIEGIDTKWLSRHATLILALLGDEPPEEQDDAPEEPSSHRLQLHKRLGLRVPPDLIQVGILDPALRDQIAGMRHIAAGIDDLNRWPRIPDTVVILENKETGYAVVDDHPGTVVLHGLGFSVAHYARINWVRSARKVIYWGDIDIPGLGFLSDLRGLGINAETILMDIETLDRFRHLAVAGAGASRLEIPHLTEPERKLYQQLLNYAAQNDTGLLLEQERIAWDHAYAALTKAIR
ncbi:Wadjet anti-phage system protein JetD domain-containing protein [Saccharopolyspora shandongensis]|uniref:DUF3322 domain-containing protein n=1 Tax=Saccharopolyspora shandongensis TaxID=418495 RepID=UPI0033EE4DFE